MSVKKELSAWQVAFEKGEPFELKSLRPYRHEIGKEWFAHLRMDIESLDDPRARPRGL